MIRFKQKEFIAWMVPLTIAGLGQGAIQMKQANDQAQEAERQAQETQKALDRQTKALNKIASEAKKTPDIAQQVAQQKQMSDTRIKLFAAPAGLANNVKGFAKDLFKINKGNITRAGKMGLSFGAMGYAGNRIATSIKDHDEGNDGKNKNFLGKAALGAAAVGGTYLAAKRGMLGKTPINALNGKTGSEAIAGGIKRVGRAINPIQRDKAGKIEKLGTGLNASFIAMPVVGYLGQRKQQKDQIAQTEENSRNYSEKKEGSTKSKLLKTTAALGGLAGTVALARRGKLGAGSQKFIGNATAQIGGTLKSAGANRLGERLAKDGSNVYAKGLEKAGKLNGQTVIQAAEGKYKTSTGPNKISGMFNKGASFFGFFGKGGTEAVQNTANRLASSQNSISKGLGEYMQKHKTTANIGAGVGSLAAGGAIMGAAGKPFKVFDSHAYDIEKENEQKV